MGLDLSYNNLSSVSGLRDFSQLEELVLDNNQLRDLNTLPLMPGLTTLSLNNNKVSVYEYRDNETIIELLLWLIDYILPQLSDIEGVLERITACCPCLKYVSLLGNPGCPDQLTDPSSTDDADYERYRRYAVHVLPASMTFLDSRMISSRERKEARERGGLMRTVKVNLPNVDSLTSEEFAAAIEAKRLKQKPNSSGFLVTGNDDSDYTPLPKTNRGPSELKSMKDNVPVMFLFLILFPSFQVHMENADIDTLEKILKGIASLATTIFKQLTFISIVYFMDYQSTIRTKNYLKIDLS